MEEMETAFQIMGRNMLLRLKETPGRFEFVRKHINTKKSFIELFTFIYDLKESHEFLKPTFMQSQKSEIIARGYRSNGNVLFLKGELGKAMEYYNLSLVLAPHPYLDDDPTMFYGHDEEDIFTPERLKPFRYNASPYCNEDYSALALAYADRSAVFYELGLYERCVRDIRLAFQSDCPVEYMDFLDKRMNYCLKVLEDEQKKTSATSHLNNEPCCSKNKESTYSDNRSSGSKKSSSDSVKGRYRSSRKSNGSNRNPPVLKKNYFLAGKDTSSTPQNTTGSDKDPSNSGRDTTSSNDRSQISRKVSSDSSRKSPKAGKETFQSNKDTNGSDKDTSNSGRNSSSSNSGRNPPDSNSGRQAPDFNSRKHTPVSCSGRDTPTSNSGRDTPTSNSGRDTPTSNSGRDTPSSNLSSQSSIKESSDSSKVGSNSGKERLLSAQDFTGLDKDSSISCRNTTIFNNSSESSSKESSDASKKSSKSGKEISHSNKESTGLFKDSSNSGRDTPSSEGSILISSKESSDSSKRPSKDSKEASFSNKDFTISDKDSSKWGKDTPNSDKSSQSLSNESMKSVKRSSKTSKGTNNSYKNLNSERSLESSKCIHISNQDSNGSSDDNSNTKSHRSSKRASSLNKSSLNGSGCVISATESPVNRKSTRFKSSKAKKVSPHSNKTSCDSGNDSSSIKTSPVTDRNNFESSTKAISDSANLSQQGCTPDDRNYDSSLGACHLDEKSFDPNSEKCDSGSDTVSTGSNEDYNITFKNLTAIEDIFRNSSTSDYSPGVKKIKEYIMAEDPKPPAIKDPHPLIPAFTSAVRLGFEPAKGKCVFATRYIRPGEVIAVEKAFSVSSEPTRLSYACGYCLKDAIDPLPCPGCILVTYCSESCRFEAMAEDHWLECSILPTLDALGLHHRNLAYKMFKTLDYTRLMALMGETGKKNPKRRKRKKGGARTSSSYTSTSYHCWQNMCTNLDKQSFEYLFVQCQTAFMLTKLLILCGRFFIDEEGVGVDPTREEILKTGAVVLSNILKVRSNALEIVDKRSKLSLGVGLYHAISNINHSCSPSAEEYNCGRVMILRAIKPIYEGEEITISYVWNYCESTQEERDKDLAMYSITCCCEACIFGWGIYNELPYMALELCRSEDEKNQKITSAIAECFKVGIKVNTGLQISPEEKEILVKTIEILYLHVPVPCQDLCYVQKLILLSSILERN